MAANGTRKITIIPLFRKLDWKENAISIIEGDIITLLTSEREKKMLT